MESVFSILFLIALLYLVAGLVFYFPFVSKGMKKIDDAVPGSTWGFRLIILPGVVVLWPVMLRKWMKAGK